jgi:hypothetical protein
MTPNCPKLECADPMQATEDQSSSTELKPRKPRKRRSHAARAAQVGVPLQCYTTPQYCAVYGDSKSSLYRQWAAGKGPPRFKRGGKTLIPVDGAAAHQRSLLEQGACE